MEISSRPNPEPDLLTTLDQWLRNLPQMRQQLLSFQEELTKGDRKFISYLRCLRHLTSFSFLYPGEQETLISDLLTLNGEVLITHQELDHLKIPKIEPLQCWRGYPPGTHDADLISHGLRDSNQLDGHIREASKKYQELWSSYNGFMSSIKSKIQAAQEHLDHLKIWWCAPFPKDICVLRDRLRQLEMVSSDKIKKLQRLLPPSLTHKFPNKVMVERGIIWFRKQIRKHEYMEVWIDKVEPNSSLHSEYEKKLKYLHRYQERVVQLDQEFQDHTLVEREIWMTKEHLKALDTESVRLSEKIFNLRKTIQKELRRRLMENTQIPTVIIDLIEEYL